MAGEVGDGDQGAARIVTILEEILTHLDKAVAVARLFDEYGHANDIGEATAGALEHRVDLRNHLFRLCLEVVGDILAIKKMQSASLARMRVKIHPDFTLTAMPHRYTIPP